MLKSANDLYNAAKNNIKSLKIGNMVSEDEVTVEEEITKFFHALFNGHHNTRLEDTGEPFQADNSEIDYFLQDLSALPDDERDNLIKEMKIEELEEIVGHSDHNKFRVTSGVGIPTFSRYTDRLGKLAGILLL